MLNGIVLYSRLFLRLASMYSNIHERLYYFTLLGFTWSLCKHQLAYENVLLLFRNFFRDVMASNMIVAPAKVNCGTCYIDLVCVREGDTLNHQKWLLLFYITWMNFNQFNVIPHGHTNIKRHVEIRRFGLTFYTKLSTRTASSRCHSSADLRYANMIALYL